MADTKVSERDPALWAKAREYRKIAVQYEENRADLSKREMRIGCRFMLVESADIYERLLKEKTEKDEVRKRQASRQRESAKIKAIPDAKIKEEASTILSDIKGLEIAMRFMQETPEVQKDAFFDLIRAHIAKGFVIPPPVVTRLQAKLEKDTGPDDIHRTMCELLRVAVAFLPNSRRYLAYCIMDTFKKNDKWSTKQFLLGKKLWGEAVRPC